MTKYKDADELLKRLNACKYPAEKTTMRQVTYNAAISDACRIVDSLPAADVVEVRHGRWIDEIYTAGVLKMYGHKCSVCGEYSCCRSPYCGECGAKMDEVTE